MSINEDQEWAPRPPKETPIEVYASFSRQRAGLLYVLQAILMLGQLAITGLVHGRLGPWAPTMLLPLFLAYFPLRSLMWERLYRQHGHLDTIGQRGQVGRSLLRMAALLACLFITKLGLEAALASLLWISVPIGALLLWGRLPADAEFGFENCFLSLAIVYTELLYSRALPWLIAFPFILAGRGVFEHRLFLRSGWPVVGRKE